MNNRDIITSEGIALQRYFGIPSSLIDASFAGNIALGHNAYKEDEIIQIIRTLDSLPEVACEKTVEEMIIEIVDEIKNRDHECEVVRIASRALTQFIVNYIIRHESEYRKIYRDAHSLPSVPGGPNDEEFKDDSASSAPRPRSR